MKTINYFLLFIFITLSEISLNSDTNAQIVNGYGLKLGIGLANQQWDYADFDVPVVRHAFPGISVRAFADFFDIPFFNIEAELGYSQKGMITELETIYVGDYSGDTYVLGSPGEITKISYLRSQLNYLSATLMGKFKHEFGFLTPYLLLGPQFNHLSDFKADRIYESEYKNFNRNVIGITTGIGTILKIRPVNFLLEYRFERDLSNNYYIPNVRLDVNNFSHTFLIGVQF